MKKCYDGGRHRWRPRKHWNDKGQSLLDPWCERCGKWYAEVRKA